MDGYGYAKTRCTYTICSQKYRQKSTIRVEYMYIKKHLLYSCAFSTLTSVFNRFIVCNFLCASVCVCVCGRIYLRWCQGDLLAIWCTSRTWDAPRRFGCQKYVCILCFCVCAWVFQNRYVGVKAFYSKLPTSICVSFFFKSPSSACSICLANSPRAYFENSTSHNRVSKC